MEPEADVIDVEEVSEHHKLVTAALSQEPEMIVLFGEANTYRMLLEAFPQMTEKEQEAIWADPRWKVQLTMVCAGYDTETQNRILELREMDAQANQAKQVEQEVQPEDHSVGAWIELLQEQLWRIVTFGKKKG